MAQERAKVPVVNINHAITTINFDYRRDQRHYVVADMFDVRTLVYCQAISELHQCGRRTCFRRVDRPGDVINGK